MSEWRQQTVKNIQAEFQMPKIALKERQELIAKLFRLSADKHTPSNYYYMKIMMVIV